MTGVIFSTRADAFVASVEEHNARIVPLSPKPEKGSCKYRHTYRVVESLSKTGTEDFNKEDIDSSPDPIFAEEYAVSGWFKWKAPAE